jgi:putative addiction module component
MSITIEHIKQEIRSLAPSDVNHLLRDLQSEYVMPSTEDDEASVETAWDAEIAERVKDVEEGRVALISGAELQRGTDALFAELGIKRLA